MLVLLKAISFLIGHIPYGIALFAGRMIGSLAFRIDKKRKRITIENLTRAFSGRYSASEIDAIAAKVFENLAVMFFEFMKLPWLTEKTLGRYVEFTGLEHFDSALKKGKGVLLITGHFGNWELLAVALALRGYRLDVVARELDSPLFERFVLWVRTRHGNRLISKSRSMRRLMKSLAENSIAALLVDQNVALAEGVFVDFFSIPACTNKGPALLAETSSASAVPAFIVREGRKHRVVVLPEIPLVSTGSRADDIVVNTGLMAKAVEEMIRRYPDQWFWVHRRWKTRPPT